MKVFGSEPKRSEPVHRIIKLFAAVFLFFKSHTKNRRWLDANKGHKRNAIASFFFGKKEDLSGQRITKSVGEIVEVPVFCTREGRILDKWLTSRPERNTFGQLFLKERKPRPIVWKGALFKQLFNIVSLWCDKKTIVIQPMHFNNLMIYLKNYGFRFSRPFGEALQFSLFFSACHSFLSFFFATCILVFGKWRINPKKNVIHPPKTQIGQRLKRRRGKNHRSWNGTPALR